MAPSSNLKSDEASEDKLDESVEKCDVTTPGLPYWVEASQNICKEDVKEENEIAGSDSGYCSIADSAHAESIVQKEADGINEKISEIFDSMHLEEVESVKQANEGTDLPKYVSSGAEGRKQRRKTVSGYFQDWTSWIGSVETKNKDDEYGVAGVGEDF